MKTIIALRHRRSTGYALLVVLVMTAISALILAATLNRTFTEAKLNDMNNQFVTSLNAAEAATEKVAARMRYDYLTSGVGGVTNNYKLNIYSSLVPSASESSFWTNFVFSDGQGHLNNTYVRYVSNWNGNLPSQYPGLNAFGPIYRILSNAKKADSRYNVTNAVQQYVLLTAIPITQFAIFYNGLLEFSTCATLTVNGRTHANGAIYTGPGSGATLTFNGTVTTASTLSAPKNNGQGPWSMPGGNFNGNPGYSTNYMSIALPIGTNNPHAIIDLPPAGESPTSDFGQQRLYNEAQIVILVSNSTTAVKIQSGGNGAVPGSDSSPTVLISSNSPVGVLRTNFPFLTLLWGTNGFYDQRESKTNLTAQIDIAKYTAWITTNAYVVGGPISTNRFLQGGIVGTNLNYSGKYPSSSGTYPTILYVADNRTTTSSQMNAVRLTNGVVLPFNGGNGFSVATPDPLYVLGHYNASTNGGPVNLGTTNTSQTVPAALMADALTVLSSSWRDSQSAGSYSTRNAANLTINAAIIVGNVPSTGNTSTTFSGGVHNLPRLLENWNGDRLTLNTSIINLFASTHATRQFQNPGVYYSPPTRQFYFDFNFLDPAKVPPGTPCLPFFQRFSWSMAQPNNVN